MTPETFTTRVEVLLSLMFFVWFVYGRWQQLIVDVTRHELFKIRNRIFLMAADGKISFTSTQYKELRETFNGLIRYAHKITFPRLMAMSIANHYERPKRLKVTEILGSIEDDAVRHALEMEWRKAADFVSLGTFLRSPMLLLVTVVLAPFSPFLTVIVMLDRQRYQVRYKNVRHSIERGIDHEVWHSQPVLKPA